MVDFNVCTKCNNLYVTTSCPCEQQKIDIKISDGTEPFIANPPFSPAVFQAPVVPWQSVLKPAPVDVQLSEEQMKDLADKVAEIVIEKILDRIVDRILLTEEKK